jgi:hypothetical protein
LNCSEEEFVSTKDCVENDSVGCMATLQSFTTFPEVTFCFCCSFASIELLLKLAREAAVLLRTLNCSEEGYVPAKDCVENDSVGCMATLQSFTTFAEVTF